MIEEEKPLNEQIRNAINNSPYTLHEFTQLMSIKLRKLESYIDGSAIPEKKTLSKMNKFLKTKMKLNIINN
tara:strand:+ start:1351 stop:1563 length:213 start_codon:yes stop_codon:yes gene_type:complete